MATRRRQVYELDAENAKLFDAYRELDAAQRKSLAESAKGAQAAKRHTKETHGLAASFKRAAESMAGFISAQAAMSGIKTFINDITQALEKNKDAAQESIDAITRYSALMSMGPEDREFLMQHAGRLNLSEAASIAFTGASRGASREGIVDILKEANIASMMGEGPETISNIVTAHRASFGDRSLAQVSSMITNLAKESPFTTEQLANIAPRITGIAGATEEDKVIGVALASAIGEGMGADARPELAATAARQFLVKRTGDNVQEYFEQAGVSGGTAIDQIEQMARDVESGSLSEKRMKEMFGEEAAPAILSMLRSESAMSGLRSEAATGVLSLTMPGETSEMARMAAVMAEKDPEWAMTREAQLKESQREIAAARRGYKQSPYELAKQELYADLEKEQLPLVGEAGGPMTGFIARGSHAYHENLREEMTPFSFLTDPVGASARASVSLLGDFIGGIKAFVDSVNENRDAIKENTQAQKQQSQPRETVSVRPEVE